MASDSTLSQLKKALSSIKELRARLEAAEQARHEPIAIIGMGCRFPGGANTPEQYWELLATGTDAIRETPADRWDVDALYDSDPTMSGTVSTRNGGYLDQIDQFDPQFFGIAPKEAVSMDPQQRLWLQVSWEALEYAGLTREKLAGSLTGVFVGLHSHSIDYYLKQIQSLDKIDVYTGTGTSHSVTGGRLSYLLDLHGPNVTLDTACSSSLVAVHLAIQSLRSRESNMAIAGGVNLMLTPQFTVAASRMQMLAPDGRCKTFDQRADGFTRGEGCGVVILKRLADAERDGDRVLAVIRGSAVNQDGKSNGLTAPNGLSQEAVIRAALADAGVDAGAISYIEAHGTGTPLGDPIEVEALAAVLSTDNPQRQTCYLGSAKTNIGHLEGAAGVAGLIKVVLSMQHQAIPPLLHFTGLNPHISFDGTPFAVTTTLKPWTDEKLLAGVSSFGWSGTNAHLIVEAAPALPADTSHVSDRPVLVPLSAPSPEGLHALAASYHSFLQNAGDLPLSHIGATAGLHRTHFDYRLAVTADSHAEAAAQIEAFLHDSSPVIEPTEEPRRIVFLFPGQGGQWLGMGQRLLEQEPVFRAALERCETAFQPYVDWSLLAELQSGERLGEIDVVQPMLFALQVALSELWRAWGVEPDAIIGHSLGEVAGAYVAGIISLEDGARIICRRSQLMRRLSGQGAMAVVGLSFDETQATLDELGIQAVVGIAVSNSPRSTVVSGDPAAVETLLTALRTRNIFCRAVNVDVAAHSPQMEALRPLLIGDLQGLQVAGTDLTVYSTVTGSQALDGAFDDHYWGDNLRRPVLFGQAVQQALADGFNTFIEIGPHPVLLTAVEQNSQHVRQSNTFTLASMRRDTDDRIAMLEALGQLYMAGFAVDWERQYPPEERRVVSLPNYPWQQQRFWFEEGASSRSGRLTSGHPLIGQRLPALAVLPGSMIWENVLDQRFQRYTQKLFTGASDHDIIQAMVLTAAEEAYGTIGHQVTGLQIEQALLSAGHDSPAMQLVMQDQGDTADFHIYTRLTEQSEWLENAHGQLQLDQTPHDYLYQLAWRAEEKSAISSVENEQNWLIFADQGGIGAALAQQLTQCRLVYAGDQYTAAADDRHFTINPTQPEDFAQLFAAVGPCQRIVYLWGLDLPETEALTPEQLQSFGVDSVVYGLQALVPLEWSRMASLWLVTRGAVSVLDSTPLPGLGQSLLWGLGRTIALEHPDVWGGLIDLAPELAVEYAAEHLLAEITAPDAEDQIAYTPNGIRHIARLARVAGDRAPDVSAWRSDGTYLITGGLGGLGLLTARRLVDQGVRHLMLIGRRGLTDDAKAVITTLEAQGTQVQVFSADVSHPDDVRAVLAEIERSMPPLCGIIHSAAVIDNSILIKLENDRTERVLRPKVAGTWNLHVLTQHLDLDCFIVYSSFAALFGIAGEGNYAAANAFMDSLMHHRHGLGQAGLAVNWGTWDEYGRAMEMRQFLGTLGLELMAPSRALAGLSYFLATDHAQGVVAAINWEAFREYYVTSRQRRLLDEVLIESTTSPITAHVSLVSLLEQTPVEERQALIAEVVRRTAADILGFDEHQPLDVRRGFFALGMDSLMAIQVRNQLENKFECYLPATVAFEYPTVEALTAYIATEIFKLAGRESVPVAPVEEAAVIDLDALSQDDLMGLLDDELRNLDKLMGDD